MQFYKRQEKAAEDMPLRETTDWGRGEPLTVKFDPTLIKGPTYLLKNQPVEQFYRESNLELSNVRLNDQLLPKALMDNLLEKQIGKKFPMDHPLTSQISQKALFPDFVAPEDVHKGEEALNATILSGRTPKKFDPVTVVNKSAGKPYRHEIVHEKLPSQHKGLSYYDNDYYQYPKPDQSQTFYPSPPSMLAPNRNIRAPEERLDARTANVLANKERELMQSANQIEYFADGLGTRAPLNSDDLAEKVARFVSTSQVVQDKMKPYFKRGDGISKATAVRIQGEEPPLSYEDYQSEGSLPGKKILTEVERDEIRMENGKEYKNFPLNQYKDVEKLPTFRGLGRAKTMIEISRNSQKVSKPNKLEEEKQRIEAEYKDRIQRMQMNNRQAEIDLIRPRENIELLRMKYASLEKPRDQNAAPLLRQNTAPYVKTFYDQTSKYLGERSELYRNPSIYDPRLLRQHVELTKEGAPMHRFYSDGSPYISSHLEGRTVRFADQVFDEHLNGIRAPLENILLDPNSVAHAVVQEGGFINKQSTYGDAYNTKKFLQENALVAREPIAYERLKQSEIDAQDVVLKEKNDDKTNEIPSGYPRIYGPIPPEPYEPLYCTNDISEMSDGYYKRSTHRVYASPNVKPSNRYEALRSDIEAMRAFEAEQNRVAQEREARAQSAHQSLMAESRNHEIAHSKHDRVARRDDPADKANDLIDPPRTTYSAAYQPYRFDHTVRCPPNEYYKQIEYSTTASEKPADLIELQDKWSKSIANRRFHSAFHTRSTDLRLPGGKKKVKTNISAQFA